MSLAAIQDPTASMPGEYYAAVSPQSPAGAEAAAMPGMMPTGVLRKQGQSQVILACLMACCSSAVTE